MRHHPRIMTQSCTYNLSPRSRVRWRCTLKTVFYVSSSSLNFRNHVDSNPSTCEEERRLETCALRAKKKEKKRLVRSAFEDIKVVMVSMCKISLLSMVRYDGA